jgi:glyoxalase family protein
LANTKEAGGSPGLHHITAIAGDPQANLDFYTGVLGLRFVKKTVNFDDPGTYHLYYGDEIGNPGTVLTFFPWGPRLGKGRQGVGQAVVIGFSVPEGALDFWQRRLQALDIEVGTPRERFGERVVELSDPDGLSLALVEDSFKRDERSGYATEAVPSDVAIRGFHSVLLAEEGYEQTAELLTGPLGFHKVAEEGNRVRFAAPDNGVEPTARPGAIVDIACMPTAPRGRMGTGSIHHVAFRTPDHSAQVATRGDLLRAGANVTPVIDRQYFHSVYFREPGGVLFEVATDPPGFTIDEPKEALGGELKLPPQYESKREAIERALPDVTVPEPFAEQRVV